jgi:hypothetical protein
MAKRFRRSTLGLVAAAGVILPVAGAENQSATGVPDLSGTWRHGTLPWMVPPEQGPGPVTNRSRRADNGQSNYSELVGDYTNPILQPWAAQVVKTKGEMSLKGEVFPSPANQCWPEPPPFLFKHMAIQMLPQKDKVVMLFNEDHEVRTVRLNAQHPARVTPTWHGDSVGYYEGDTLIIDTVGIKADRKFAMIDLFGTPYTDKLHVVERWQLLDREAVKGDLERGTKENWRPGAPIDPNYADKFLRVQFTIEDEGTFTTPWTASMVYTRDPTEWAEAACAENLRGFSGDQEADVPQAKTPDF